MQQLSTSHNMFTIAFFPKYTADTLNTIINMADGQTTTRKDVGKVKFNKRINWELERRGIDYRISSSFCKPGTAFLMHLLIIPTFIEIPQVVNALNLLCEDYNKRG